MFHHREIPGHVDAGDKHRFDVSRVSTIAGECHPRVVVLVLFRIFFKDPLELNFFPVNRVLSQKGSTSVSCELERDAGSGFQHAKAHA